MQRICTGLVCPMEFSACKQTEALYLGYRSLFASVISRRTLQGTPTATTLAGMSFLTRLPAPITVLSPIVTPANMVAPAPIQTLFPI